MYLVAHKLNWQRALSYPNQLVLIIMLVPRGGTLYLGELDVCPIKFNHFWGRQGPVNFVKVSVGLVFLKKLVYHSDSGAITLLKRSKSIHSPIAGCCWVP